MFKNMFQKYRDRKQLKTALQLLRGLYPNINVMQQHGLVTAVWDLAVQYKDTWGDADGIAQFCFDRINYIVTTHGGLSV